MTTNYDRQQCIINNLRVKIRDFQINLVQMLVDEVDQRLLSQNAETNYHHSNFH